MWDKNLDNLEDDSPETAFINGVWVYKDSELCVDMIYKDGKTQLDCGYWYCDQEGDNTVFYSIVDNDFDLSH